MVMGRPSPGWFSPTLVSRSTGPQPLVADRKGRSLTATDPGGGGAGIERTMRSSAFVVALPDWVYEAVVISAAAEVKPCCGAVTGQLKRADWPGPTWPTWPGTPAPTV